MMSGETPRGGAPLRTPTALKIPKSRLNGGDNNSNVVNEEQGAANGAQAQATQSPDSHLDQDSPEAHPMHKHDATNATKSSSGQLAASNNGQGQYHGNTPAPTSTHQEQCSPIDPLSEQILRRTTTDKSLPKVRSQTLADTEPSGVSETHRSFVHDEPSAARRDSNAGLSKTAKDKKKGTSFLSRFIGTKKRGGVASESNDDISELGEGRVAGMDAEVFAQPIGFTPRYPPPPKYIKVRSHHKKGRDFNRLFVAQELKGRSEPANSPHEKSNRSAVAETNGQETTGKAIWALEYSKDGKYLAAAGQDRKVYVWSVIATPEDRQAHEIEEEARNDQPLVHLSAPVFKTQPVQEFEGHTASVVDLSWSKNNFLLSTSMDKTVRLWHITRNECLCIFKHSDFVTSIEFHPRDDRFFLAGSLDSKLRLWSIPDKAVAYLATVPDMVTAVAFTPDGKHSVAGCLNGLCLVYDTDGLKVQSQIHVRSARGKNAKGSKITGINTVVHPPDSENGIIKLLVTSNDSRIRLYNFRDRTLEAKFRGNENATSQIRSSFSSDGRYIICGSEDRRAYIWPLSTPLKDADKRPVEFFEAHSSIVTSAVFAPIKTKQVLDSTGDLLYDLCNPPPVTLVSQAPSSTSKQPTEDGKPGNDEAGHSVANARDAASQRKPESSTYLARSEHPDGNILVTADVNGSIKVFRQDCGYHRRPHDALDENASFPRKLLRRANSINRRRSIASSVGKSSHHKTPSERILSWRSGVVGSHNENLSVDNLRGSPGSQTRSTSPTKSLQPDSPARRVSDTRRGAHSPGAQPNASSALRESTHPNAANQYPDAAHTGQPEGGDVTPQASELSNPLWLKGDQSYMFWDTARPTDHGAGPHRSSQTYPARRESVISALSSDISDSNAAGEETEEAEEDDEDLSCRRCGGTNFRATRTRQGEQRLICVQCGSAAS